MMTAGVALAPAAGAQQPSDDASLESLSVVSGVGQTKMTPAFDPEITDYFVAAPSEGDMVTVNVEANHDRATLRWIGRDADPNLPGHQVAVTAGTTESVSVRVEAEDGETYGRFYGIRVARASNLERGWRVYDDVLFDDIVDDPRLPNHYLAGLWADEDRVFVSAFRHDPFDQKFYAFSAADSSRRPDDEFVLSGRPDSGIWSDGTTLWALDSYGTLRAYNLSTGSEIADQSTDVSPDGYYDTRDVDAPRGIWSDGDTLWVVDKDNAKVVAFALPTKCSNNDNYCRQPEKDFDLAAENDNPWGITAGWSGDGPDRVVDTFWVSNATEDRVGENELDKKLYAYNRSDGSRNSDLDFDLKQLDISNLQQFYYGLAATETIMYVAEFITGRIYSFSMPGVSGPIGPALMSSDATLSSLSLTDDSSNAISYTPTLTPGHFIYTVEEPVEPDVTSVTVTAIPTNHPIASAEVIVNGQIHDDGVVSLEDGINTIVVRVTAQDRTTKDYTVGITRRAKSTDATLDMLELSRVTLDPVFSSARAGYTASVVNGVESTAVTATPTDSAASYVVELGGVDDDVVDGVDDDDGVVDLAVGANVITVVVTAEDGQTTKTYTVTVTRADPPPSTDATLDMLELSRVTLDPVFSSARAGYTASVVNGVESTAVTATPTDSAASYVVELGGVDDDGVDDDDGVVDLAVGANVITVVVTAEDGQTTKTYTVTVTRADPPPSTDATLDMLELSRVTLDPVFSSARAGYTASVVNGVESTAVTATPTDSAASYVVELGGVDDDVVDGVDDDDGVVDLAVGANVITVVVTAEDGQTTKTYTVTVTRAASGSPPSGTTTPGNTNPGFNPGSGSSNPGTTTVGDSSGDGSDSSDDESDDVTPLEDAGDAGTETEAAINALHRLAVFTGTLCQSNRLCPNDPLQRWIAAVWLVRLIDGDDPAAVTESRFEDVNASSMWEDSVWYAPHVERLADLEVTVGCTQDPLRFCPDANLTRAQVASWVARAFDLESAESQGFVDAVGSVHEANINAVVAAGVMSGCSTDPKNFCLDDTVTKGEMARYVYAARNVSLGLS